MRLANKIINQTLVWAGKYIKTDIAYAAKGSFWMWVGNGALTLVSFAVTIAFANLIPTETYGTYQFITSVLGIIALTSIPGLAAPLARGIARQQEGALAKAVRTKISWALIGSITLFIISAWYFAQENSILAGAFLVTAALFPLESAPSIFSAFWQGRKRFDLQAIYRISHLLPASAVLIVTLYFTENIILIVFALLASRALFGWLAYYRTTLKTKNAISDPGMVPFGKNLTVMSAIEVTANHLDKIILWNVIGPAQVAIYSLAIMPIQRLLTFNPIHNIALPKLSEHGVKGNARKREVFRKFIISFGATVPVAALLAFIAPFVYGLLFPQYLTSIPYFRALSILITLIPFSLLSTSLIAEMKTSFLYKEQIAVPVIKILLFLSLAPLYGVWGIVLAIVAAELIRGGLLVYFFWKM